MTVTVEQALLQAIEAHRSGRLQDAERLYRAILEVSPQHCDANHNLGVLAVGVGKPAEGLPHLKTALEANPSQGQFWISYIGALADTGRLSEARGVLDEGRRRGLTGDPVEQIEERLSPSAQSKPSQSLLDALLANYQAQNFEEAEGQARVLTTNFPNHELGWKVLGAVFSVTGRFEESLAPMRQALRLKPHDAETFKNLAISLLKLKRSAEAEEACRLALRLAPDYAQAHLNLGNALIELARTAEAEMSYREAIRLKPDYAEAYSNLGCALKFMGRLTEAEAYFRQAIGLNPTDAYTHNNLGDVFKDLSRFADAEAYYRAALELKPDYPQAHSNLLLCLNYMENVSPDAYLAEAKRYALAASAGAKSKFTSWSAKPDPARLRVGFVSGDLTNHPVGYFAEGVFQHLDRDRFELFAFPTTPKTDELTARIAPFFEGWRPIFGMHDDDAATIIHQQGIHVLIDLSGHTAHNRLPVFSFRPAPLQASWLGYFATTGLAEMDYFVGDPHLSPDSEQPRFTEKLWNLPETWLCLARANQGVPVAPSPVLANGFVTFGCLGNLSKINDSVVEVWARILLLTPNSRLFLKAKQFADAEVVGETCERFGRHGVTRDRLILEGPSPWVTYFEAYRRVDLILDTFPYPGGTTSVDALWMGVPVLTLKGDRFLSRLGESIAKNASQFDWIAKDKEGYVGKAVALAADWEGLARIRLALRSQVANSPLFEAERFARHFGDALWGMWRNSALAAKS
jgi:protein O-GlcNAc transferase